MTTTYKLDLAKTSLLGLSIGDAFGETFFGPADSIAARIHERTLQEGSWFFTDDTVMGIGSAQRVSRNNGSPRQKNLRNLLFLKSFNLNYPGIMACYFPQTDANSCTIACLFLSAYLVIVVDSYILH